MTDAAQPRWLSAEERAAWLSVSRLVGTLPGALDAQLQRDSGLNYFEYIVLAMLAEQPTGSLRMTRLAELSSSSLSRLSNVAKRLEQRGLLTRTPCPDDGRATVAVLTPSGLRTVQEAAPGHVAHVRALVVDAMTPDQLHDVRRALDQVLARVDPWERTRVVDPA